MKNLVFCLIVIANFSSNGKASVDTLGPASANAMFEDSTVSSDKSCHRPCKFNVKPRRCYYKFKIKPLIDESGKASIAINEMIPGPPINVCVNDIIVVEVENRVPDEDIAVHWHGVEQRGTPYMDGVPMVTQCPISYGSKYKYAFRASAPGTYFYHADAVSHQSDGVFGSLVVNQPQQQEPHGSLYDYDRTGENVLIASAVFPELLTGNLDMNLVKPVALNINGDVDRAKIFVIENFSYRLRLINAVAAECPLVFSVEEHELVVIASDGRATVPTRSRHVLLYPGERMDVVLRASRTPGGYWLRMRGADACAGLAARAMLLYSGFNYTSMLVQEQVPLSDDLTLAVKGQDLQSSTAAPGPAEATQVLLSVDRAAPARAPDNDYRYLSDALPKKPFFPASLSLTDKGVVQINGKSFLYPSEPLLLAPRAAPDACRVGDEPDHEQPQCVQTVQAALGDTLELVLINEGFRNNDSLTFHMHGYGLQVAATWQSPDGAPISKETFLQWDREGKVKRNLSTGPIKDTVTVPNKGYTIMRVTLDNVGSWMLECRSCASTLPAAVVVSVPVALPKSILDSLPKCGNYRPPDVLLN